ncbi:hypothetical protein QBC39DRAFT_68537 [Podospora conica]|nr:hypothetical protein QBC39DRAFT_68537 [Schizothecium conicum]
MAVHWPQPGGVEAQVVLIDAGVETMPNCDRSIGLAVVFSFAVCLVAMALCPRSAVVVVVVVVAGVPQPWVMKGRLCPATLACV